MNSMGVMKQIFSPSKVPNLIMVASLSLIGDVERAKVDSLVENITCKRKYICNSHIIKAAKSLSDEMTASGKHLSYSADRGEGTSAYYTTADIPHHLVDLINGRTDSDVVISARDVWTFVNDALKKFYGTPEWPQVFEVQVFI
ncbi:hypothetical protein COOONC_07091 [Cooperia oncophora]